MSDRLKERRETSRRGKKTRPGATRDHIVMGFLAIFLVLCLLCGGASRVTDLPLIFLRPFAVLLIGLVFGLASPCFLVPYRVPLVILGLLAITMLVQLVPLPPALWGQLPMSATYSDVLALTGLDGVWRPITIAPDLTINSLLALLPSFAVLLALAMLPSRYHRNLLTWVLAGMVFSALLGLAQFAGGDNSKLYFWIDRSEGVADGVFANRNHQAVFLACGLALLGAWTSGSQNQIDGYQIKPGIRLVAGAVIALLLLVTVVATGSRTGTILALLAMAYSYLLVIRSVMVRQMLKSVPWPMRLALRWNWIIIPLLLGLMVLSGRAVTFDRLMSTDASEDQRFRSWPVMMDMLKHVFPVGSGYGTFDPLFRTFEPAHALHYGYFNHAHNDFLELLLNGGAAAAVVILLGAAWWGRTYVRLWQGRVANQDTLLGRSAAFALLLLALASLVDYPVRTPLLSCLMAILVAWMVGGSRSRGTGQGGS